MPNSKSLDSALFQLMESLIFFFLSREWKTCSPLGNVLVKTPSLETLTRLHEDPFCFVSVNGTSLILIPLSCVEDMLFVGESSGHDSRTGDLDVML